MKPDQRSSGFFMGRAIESRSSGADITQRMSHDMATAPKLGVYFTCNG